MRHGLTIEWKEQLPCSTVCLAYHFTEGLRARLQANCWHHGNRAELPATHALLHVIICYCQSCMHAVRGAARRSRPTTTQLRISMLTPPGSAPAVAVLNSMAEAAQEGEQGLLTALCSAIGGSGSSPGRPKGSSAESALIDARVLPQSLSSALLSADSQQLGEGDAGDAWAMCLHAVHAPHLSVSPHPVHSSNLRYLCAWPAASFWAHLHTQNQSGSGCVDSSRIYRFADGL